MTSLPSLRKKILRSFWLIVALYALMGLLLVGAVVVASRSAPQVIHRNYDTIAAVTRMERAWTALRRPHDAGGKPAEAWRGEFDAALEFQTGNITEPGERELTLELEGLWKGHRSEVAGADAVTSERMKAILLELIRLNEAGMFAAAEEAARLRKAALIGGSIYFLLSLIASIFFADALANRLSRPLKAISEVLHGHPHANRPLRLPEPTSLELLILTEELKRLWGRVQETDQLNVDEILREKNRLLTVLGSVEDAVLVVEASGHVSHCNEAMIWLIGLPRAQIVGQVWKDLSSNDEDYLRLRETLREDMSGDVELELELGDQKRLFSARTRPIEGPGRTRVATLYLLHDISEKRHRDRLRSQVIDLLSHELKTPLQSLGTASELLTEKREALPEELQLLVDTISEDVERIKAVANEFVQVTHTHSKALKLKFEKIVLGPVVAEWLKPFRVIARDRGVRLELKTEGSALIAANLDRVKFPWVLSNLVSNAIRFSPANGVVTVLVTDRNGAVEIKVSDEGPGVEAADRVRIFDPFFQKDVPTPDGSRGLFGIGLTIAKEVVEAHDGRIEYCPLEPHGSAFRILLPFPELSLG